MAYIAMAESSSSSRVDDERIALLLADEMEDKDNIERAEVVPSGLRTTDSAIKHGDRALALIGDERIVLTEEDNRRIRKKTDHRILPILVWVYFLQGE